MLKCNVKNTPNWAKKNILEYGSYLYETALIAREHKNADFSSLHHN